MVMTNESVIGLYTIDLQADDLPMSKVDEGLSLKQKMEIHKEKKGYIEVGSD